MKLTSIKHLKRVDDKNLREALRHVQVIPRIDSYLEDMNLEDDNRELHCFSASDLGDRTGRSLCGHYPMGCNRLLYYRYIGEQPERNFPPRLLRIFHTGTKIHEQLQGYLNEIARRSEGADVFCDEVHVCPENSKVANDLEINSTTDGLWEINVPKLQIRFLLEIKSIKAELFQHISSKPNPENVVQTNVYMGCADVPLANILYYCKNDSVMAEFPIVFDPKIWQAIVDKINFVRECAVNDEPPPRETGFHCKQCRYKHICKPPKTGGKRAASYNRRKFSLNGASR